MQPDAPLASHVGDGVYHEPVLLQAVVEALQPWGDPRFIDATVGEGGHAAALLASSTPHGRLLGLDVDPLAVVRAAWRLRIFGRRVTVRKANFAALAAVAEETGFVGVDGILFDLGISSLQLAVAARGFSFQQEGPLDMRFDPDEPLTAATIVNTWSARDVAALLWEYGEERLAQPIARAIVARRQQQPLQTTTELAALVSRVYGHRPSRIHPATRTFQALRIAVNRELEVLPTALEQAIRLLRPGGRLAVIAFHSLEDRVVKRIFRHAAGQCICPPGTPVCQCHPEKRVRILTPHPIRPGPEEVARNPRSRSARLRIVERV